MKKLFKTKTAIIAFSILMIGILVVSCKKEATITTDLTNFDQIVGSYTGTLNGNSLKTMITAHADVQLNADSSITVHCFGGDFDTTFMLDVFDQSDSVHVCLTGNEFYNEYGHMRNHSGSTMTGFGNMMGGNTMGGNMMGGNNTTVADSTGWMYHLRVDHMSGDIHFGGFNVDSHTFGYRFRDLNNSEMFIRFEGIKNTDQ